MGSGAACMLLGYDVGSACRGRAAQSGGWLADRGYRSSRRHVICRKRKRVNGRQPRSDWTGWRGVVVRGRLRYTPWRKCTHLGGTAVHREYPRQRMPVRLGSKLPETVCLGMTFARHP
ncbi:hypothetical protein OH77DRAFT_1068933 [Trametes cingulata]|nr:hypothetical protein OH77DRAFT_1068933 [Trametes cingulata]